MFYLSCQTITVISEMVFSRETVKEITQQTHILIDENYCILFRETLP